MNTMETTAVRATATRGDRAWPRRILVGSDGSLSSGPAMRMACTLARRTGAELEIAVVYAPRIPPPPSPGRTGFARCEGAERSEAARLLHAVRRQRDGLEASDCRALRWTWRLEVGEPGASIVRIAEEDDVDLVVVGVRQPEPMNRWLGRTVMRAARHLRSPLLTAAPHSEALRRAVVAFPDGRPRAETVCAAVQCLDDGAHLWIVMPERRVTDATFDDLDAAVELAASCDPVAAERARGMTISAAPIASGDPLTAVLRLAAEAEADLLAVPTPRDPGPVRDFLPGLAEPLLLGARCSVLVVPDA